MPLTRVLAGGLTKEQKGNNIRRLDLKEAMPDTAPHPQADADRLEAAANQAIAACDGEAREAREAVKALIVANEFLEAQVADLQAAVSNGYARGRFEPVPRDRKDWYD